MKTLLFAIGLLTFVSCTAQSKSAANTNKTIIPAAERTQVYVPLLKGKRVAVFANQTSVVGQTHLIDTLKKLGINIVKAFAPEHGFRGKADAGEKVESAIDKETGIPVISLYGKKRKPTAEDLKDVDILVFDIQDVGVRFYTFISSLEDYMNAAFEHGKPLLILDRPNPNGFYVDGPVLDTAFKSFVGMQPVPVVYGMTMGEYAKMLASEKWLSAAANLRHDYYLRAENSADTNFHFLIIKNENYTHQSKYNLPVKPSPNLPDMSAIYNYPSTCFFEGTVLSEGRGTEHPFEIFGHPSLPNNLFVFTPQSKPGATNPKLVNQTCYGWNIHKTPAEVLKENKNQLQIKYLLNAYQLFPQKDSFFLVSKKQNLKPTDYFFNKLAGNAMLMEQIKQGKSEAEIRKSWQPEIQQFKTIRKKYLLYPDFE